MTIGNFKISEKTFYKYVSKSEFRKKYRYHYLAVHGDRLIGVFKPEEKIIAFDVVQRLWDTMPELYNRDNPILLRSVRRQEIRRFLSFWREPIEGEEEIYKI